MVFIDWIKMLKHHEIKNRKFAILVVVSTLFIIIAYQFYFIFFGLDTQDSFFHITRMVYDDSYVLAFLSYKSGYLWSLIFGKHILGFRILNMLLYILMLLSPLYLIKEAWKKLYLYLSLVIVNVFFALMNWNILGYDSFSFLSIIIVAVLTINYLKEYSYKNLLLLSISVAFSIAFRFPNIVLIPIMSLVIVCQGFYFKKINFVKHNLTFLFSIGIIYSLLVLWSYNSFGLFKEEFIKALRDTNEQHGLSKLINTYIYHLGKIIRNASVIIAFYALYVYLKPVKYKILFHTLFLLLGLYLFYKYIYGSSYNDRVALFMGALIFSISIIHLFYSYKIEKKITLNIIVILVLISLLFVPSMGSKSGLKYSGIFIVFFPYLYSVIDFKAKSFFIIILFFLAPLAVKERLSIKFMDKNHNQLTTRYKLPSINGVLTTKARVDLSESIAEDYKKHKNDEQEIVFYGLNSYMYNYVFGEDKLPFKTYRMDLDHEKEINLALSMVTDQNKPTFFIISPQVRFDEISSFEKKIVSKDYKREVKSGYSILSPN